MKLPKKGEEIYYVMPPRVCLAEWDGSSSLLEAYENGYIFRNKAKAKKFCKDVMNFYGSNVKNFK